MNYQEFIPFHNVVKSDGQFHSKDYLRAWEAAIPNSLFYYSNDTLDIIVNKPQKLPWTNIDFVKKVIKNSTEKSDPINYSVYMPNPIIEIVDVNKDLQDCDIANREVYYWMVIDRLKWTDKENNRNDYYAEELRNKNTSDINLLKTCITYFLPKLMHVLFNKPVFRDLPHNDIINLSYHIIARGKILYNLIIDDYTLAIFYIDKYRTLHKFLQGFKNK